MDLWEEASISTLLNILELHELALWSKGRKIFDWNNIKIRFYGDHSRRDEKYFRQRHLNQSRSTWGLAMLYTVIYEGLFKNRVVY